MLFTTNIFTKNLGNADKIATKKILKYLYEIKDNELLYKNIKNINNMMNIVIKACSNVDEVVNKLN